MKMYKIREMKFGPVVYTVLSVQGTQARTAPTGYSPLTVQHPSKFCANLPLLRKLTCYVTLRWIIPLYLMKQQGK